MEVLGFTVPLWLVLIVVVLALYTYMMSRHHGTFKKLNIPGPAPWPIIGSLREINKGITPGDCVDCIPMSNQLPSKQGFHAFQIECRKKYGKVYGYYGGLSPQTLVVGDMDMLRKILVKDFNNFSDRIIFKGFNGDMETSVNNLRGDHWKHVRNKITPAFSTGKLRKMIPLVDHASDTLVESLRRKVKDGDEVMEMLEVYGAYAMDVICSTAFGIQVDSQKNPNDEFIANAKKFMILKFSSAIILVLMFLPKLHFLMPLLGWSFIDKNVQQFFRGVTTKLLDERVAGNKDRVDFLQLMKNVQYGEDDSDDDDDGDDDKENISGSKLQNSWSRKGITFKEILGNAEIFFLAGYETTSITLTMATYYLAVHPEYQDRLRQELSDKIGTKQLTYDNIRNVEYLDMVINETLRINPPATRTDRVCLKDTEVNGVMIPAGMHITIPIYSIHHDPDIWEDPEKFIPERFAEKDRHDPLSFLPFGYGPRNCIGMRLAQMELKMSLAKVVRNFQICVCSETKIPAELMTFGLLKPKTTKLKLVEIN